MKILCVFGRYAYGDSARGDSYEAVNFLPALRALGHEVALFDSFDRSVYPDFAELNRGFLKAVQRERPDLIFCVLMGYELWSETLALARQASGACLLNWATDDSWKYEEFSRLVSPSFDIYATTYVSALDKAARDGLTNFTLSQWAAPARLLEPPKPAGACRYPVSFIGAAYGNRRQWIAGLRERGIAVSCFGHGWENGVVVASEVSRIINDSVLSLNFSDSGWLRQGKRQIKARVFEVPATGGCLLTEFAEGLEEYFVAGEEIETFADLDELAAKICKLLDAPAIRDRIARQGHARTCREHTYEIRLQKLLERAPPADGAKREMDWPAFEKLVEAHRIGVLLGILKRLLVWGGTLIWGRQRGPRAARRLLFELSWRIAGRRTYGAGGWPGRLFYRES
ncbi:MAG: glycosyltransferase [Betaproteobacteria bacterium]|nr:glycosyltransferase [Betaproteobacteria bacterium]